MNIELLRKKNQIKDMELEKIIDEAYKLYMPQVRPEITDLARMVESDILKKFCEATKENKFSYNILEIGTKFGGTFHIWNSLNGLGKNISIDMSDGGLHGGISEEDMDKRDLWFCERFPNCHFVRGDSHDSQTSAKLCEILFNKNWNDIDVWTDDYKKLDFLFIDGDHSYEGVKKDFLNFEPLCKPKSIIAFHDIIISEHHHSRNVFVGEFWNEVKNDSRFDSVEIIADINQTWAGIGILKKI